MDAPAERKQVERIAFVDRVEALIHRITPESICDDCIVERLDLGALHRASHRTHELASKRGYERHQGECSLCGQDKAVIRGTTNK